jgi:dTMP kinase
LALKLEPHPFRPEGRFVVFEGGEGTGKTTQMSALVEWLQGRGDDVITTREPGGTAIGARIRAILLDPSAREMTARTEALLYAADRAQHAAEVIKPALEDGKIVVSDRFVDSSLAYQGLARGLGLEEIYELSSWATEGLVPDLVLFMNVDADVALQRLDRDRDRIEGEQDDFHERVAAAYIELADRFSERFVVLDASRPPEEIHRDVVAAVQERILTARPQSLGAPKR